ncbi:hypothetical protein VP1G_07482 [Cytospora mali]|uniref:Mitochondrial seryl-tRNA synthetase n=1 Tax=Cytospora mali TaxID=578113 RepID=A0A194V8S9_CYTMA|nr:hypothetical protein VP1G_07482 [Valsa mali var. pyri (nom. inval.)]
MWKQHLLSSLRRGFGPLQTPTKTLKMTTAFSPRAARLRSRPGRRWNSTDTSSQKQQSRADRILSQLPASMQKYTTRLRNAPLSHVVAFLILHEMTAVVPLLGLFGLFHYTDYVPLGYMMEHYGGYVRDGTARFERYFKRKGWFGFGRDEDEAGGQLQAEGGDEGVMDRWASSDGKYKIVVEVALAYSITKVLLPVRIMASLWMTPWFAGLMVRIRGVLPGVGKRK